MKSSIQKHTGPNGVSFLTISDLAERRAVFLKLTEGNVLFFDTETTGLRVSSGESECVMIGLQFGSPREAATSEVFCCLWDDEMKQLFHEMVELASRVVGHGLRFDAHATGLPLPIYPDPTRKFFCTQMQVYYADTSSLKSLDELAPSFGHSPKIPTPSLIKNGRIREMETHVAFEYLADDVQATSCVYYKVEPWGQPSWLWAYDLPLEGVVQRMERRGAVILPDRLRTAQRKAETIARDLNAAMIMVAGPINFGSPKQLADLFRKMRWPMGQTKSGGPSINAEILEGLAETGHEFASMLLSWRKHTKLLGTFFAPLLDRAASSPTGLVHARFNTMGPKTGRFSCEDPNWQQAANAAGDAKNLAWYVRGSITHEDGVSVGDFSQIELRVVAALSGEPALLEAFARGEDVHVATAAKMFRVPLKEVTREMRSRAKAVNFGILFGMTKYGLAYQLGCSVSEAEAFLRSHQLGLPVLTAWIYAQHEVYASIGKACTAGGRTRRFFEWEKTTTGLSVEVQGTAAEMMRAALIGLEQEGHEPFIQVHDEAVCKGRGHAKEVGLIMQKCAEKAFPKLAALVRFPCDTDDGETWADAH